MRHIGIISAIALAAMLAGCGHIVPWERPAELFAVAQPFLAAAVRMSRGNRRC